MAMNNYSHNANYNASSVVNDKTIVSFSANYYSINSVNFSKTINDVDTYLKNKEAVDADELEFQEKVISDIQNDVETTSTTSTSTK